MKPSNCRDSAADQGAFAARSITREFIQQADNPGNDGDIGEVKNVPVKAPIRRGNVEKDEIGNPAIGQAVDGIANCTADNQAEGERDQPVLRAGKPEHEQQDRNCLEAQQNPLAEWPLVLEKPVADARIAREHDIDKRAESYRSVGGEIENKQQVNLGSLVERADDCGDGQSETRQRAGKIGTGDQYLLRRSARCFPFAQRLSVTWRHIGIVGIGAYRGENFPRARAFFPFRKIRHDCHACDFRQSETHRRALRPGRESLPR